MNGAERENADYLIVADMQNDFVTGTLGTPETHKTALAAMKACQIEIVNE